MKAVPRWRNSPYCSFRPWGQSSEHCLSGSDRTLQIASNNSLRPGSSSYTARAARWSSRIALLVTATALLLSACGSVKRPDGGTGLLPPGERSNLSGKDQNGNGVELASLQGHCVVVYFYPKDGTPGCTKEACAFRDVWKQYQEKHVNILGVSNDDSASHQRFTGEHQLPFSLIADTDGTWAKSFGVSSTAGFYSRVSFLLDAKGRVAKVYEKVDPGVHANQVLADVEQLGCL
jgi:thioredoxin-dependent peroxiredoxin